MTTKLRAASFQDGAVTTAKIAASAITNTKIADGTVTANQLSIGQIGGRRNIIINGAMQVDQRNSGSSYAQINSQYSLDRFRGNSCDGGAATGKFTVIQSSTAPDDFSHSLLVTSSAATSDAANNIFNIEQLIEGFNSAHLNYGSSSAQTITLSFYVRSSLTGTFGGALKNSARNRNYPFTYTINSANTFERKTITISGDTSGTWVGSTNGTGLWVSFGLGVGSNYSGSAGAWGAGDYFSATGATSVVGTSGATWYITGVQREVGSQATPFEHRSFGEELQLCRRYYLHVGDSASTSFGVGALYTASVVYGSIFLPVKMRTGPTLDATSGTSYYQFYTNGSGDPFNSVTLSLSDPESVEFYNQTEISSVAGHSGFFRIISNSGRIALTAEL